MPTSGRKATRERERRRGRIKALATQIPEELFERILDYVGRWRDHDGVVRYSNKELGRCALVCKYWATNCQAKIFHTIKLRTHKDVWELLALLDSPLTNIGGYIEALRGPLQEIMGTSTPPWMHLVPPLHPNLPLCRRLEVELAGPLPKKTRTLRSVHWRLPRALPTHSAQLQKLTLHGIEVAAFRDLVHLLDELRDLRHLEGHGLTWAERPPLNGLRTTGPRGCTRLDKVVLLNCPATEYTFWLHSIYRAPPGTPRLRADSSFITGLESFLTSTVAVQVVHQFFARRLPHQSCKRHSFKFEVNLHSAFHRYTVLLLRRRFRFVLLAFTRVAVFLYVQWSSTARTSRPWARFLRRLCEDLR